MTDANNINPAGVTFIDNPHAPDFFADGASGYFALNGNIKVTFESARVNHHSTPGPVARVVIGRVVMPIEAAERMARDILGFVAQQRDHGGEEQE